MNKPLPLTLEELQLLREPIPNVNETQEESLTRLEKLAIWITEHVGSMGFFFIVLAWTLAWLGWNTLGPKGLRFDPYPGFVLWLFISNMIQLFLMPLIMVGQNLLSRHAEFRSQADFELNKQAVKEVEVILHHLEYQNGSIAKILEEVRSLKSGS